jgi:hypothetical protein
MISPVQAIAFMIDTKEFSEDYIIPGIFDKIVTAYVASGVELLLISHECPGKSCRNDRRIRN